MGRTAARKFSIEGLYVCAGGLGILKFDGILYLLKVFHISISSVQSSSACVVSSCLASSEAVQGGRRERTTAPAPKNHHGGYQLKVESFPGKLLPFQNNQTYLGITLDRSLTFKDHILKLKNKISSRVALIKRLADLTWGCSFNVLRTSTSALLYAPAKYCSQAW